MRNAPAKQWWQSKTIIGAGAVLVSAVFHVVELDSGAIGELLTEAGIFAGAVLAIIGRITASGKIERPLKRADEASR